MGESKTLSVPEAAKSADDDPEAVADPEPAFVVHSAASVAEAFLAALLERPELVVALLQSIVDIAEAARAVGDAEPSVATRPATISVPEAGRTYFGLGRNASYEAAHRGDIPVIRIGRILRVPVVALERRLEEAGGKPEAA